MYIRTRTWGPLASTIMSICSCRDIGCSSISMKRDMVLVFLPSRLNSGEMSGLARSKKKAYMCMILSCGGMWQRISYSFWN